MASMFHVPCRSSLHRGAGRKHVQVIPCVSPKWAGRGPLLVPYSSSSWQAVAFINAHRMMGRKVYIHCKAPTPDEGLRW